MNTLMTDYFAIELPEHWYAEQEEETIIITDDDEVSVIEMTVVPVAKGESIDDLLEALKPEGMFSSVLSEIPAFYHEFVEEGGFWREWFCVLEHAVLIVSHGTEEENKGMDDASVDEILATLSPAINKPEE